MEICGDSSKKLKLGVSFHPNIPLLGILPKELWSVQKAMLIKVQYKATKRLAPLKKAKCFALEQLEGVSEIGKAIAMIGSEGQKCKFVPYFPGHSLLRKEPQDTLSSRIS